MYVALIVLSLVAGAILLFGRNAHAALWPKLTAWGLALAIGGVWIARWIGTGHLPLFGTYENALSVALACALAGIVWPAAAAATSLVSAMLLAQGVAYDAMPYALTISERSLVVDIHAILAWLAFGAFSAAFGLAVRAACSGDASRSGAALQRTLLLGFFLHTAMIATGSLYKFMLFGRVWSWDPIETMAVISWLAYGTLIHMAPLAGWSPIRIARWSLGTFVILVVSYRAIIYFPSFATYHIFDIALKLHQ